MHILVSGSIGVGKSTVIEMMKKHIKNIPFFSIDEYVASLYQNENIKKRLTELYGTAEKKEISNLYFSNKEVAETIDKIFFRQIDNFLGNIKNQNKHSISEFPIAFEYNYNNYFDYVILISANDEIRTQRIKQRNGFSDEKIQQIFAKQLPQEEKIKKSNFVIYNNSTLEELENQIIVLSKNILNNIAK